MSFPFFILRPRDRESDVAASALINQRTGNILFLVAFALLFAALRGPALAMEATVSTVAGTGSSGYEDGGALTTASFLFPSGIASDASGNLYVADTAAQRVREISPKGVVRTVAGAGNANIFGLWVPGGWADGLASNAKFDAPTGVAVLGKRIFIADTDSSLIRLLTDGYVSTYAGTPFKQGNTDGPRSSALFVHPIGLAIDTKGSLFIADAGGGIRKIDADGMVSTLKVGVEIDRPLGLAIHEDPGGETLFIADALGIVRVQPSGQTSRANPEKVQGGTPLGYPSAISAVDDHSIVYADSRTHTIRYFDFSNRYTRILGGQATDVAAETSGAFKDGAASQSFFDAPTGVLYRKGDVIVADSGNKRIRRIANFDQRSAVNVSNELIPPCSANTNQRQTAYVGNSFGYWDTDWESSVPGQIERWLNHTAKDRGQEYKVSSLQILDATLNNAADYLELLATSHCYNTVIFSVNSVSLKGVPGFAQRAWVEPAAAIFRRMRKAYAEAGVGLLVVVIPTHLEVGPAEATWVKMPQAALEPTDSSDSWLLTLRSSGVHYVDMWPTFISDLKSPQHRALYGTVDSHLTPHARALVASSVERALQALLRH